MVSRIHFETKWCQTQMKFLIPAEWLERYHEPQNQAQLLVWLTAMYVVAQHSIDVV